VLYDTLTTNYYVLGAKIRAISKSLSGKNSGNKIRKIGCYQKNYQTERARGRIEEIRKGNQNSPKMPDRRLASDFSSSGVKQR